MPYISSPVKPQERHIILDALRGVALLGICLANYSEFSLYSFLPDKQTAAMSTANVDTAVKYFQYVFIDRKFYTLFSLLFGIGFSIILSNAAQKKCERYANFLPPHDCSLSYRFISSFVYLGRRHPHPVCFCRIFSAFVPECFEQKFIDLLCLLPTISDIDRCLYSSL